MSENSTWQTPETPTDPEFRPGSGGETCSWSGQGTVYLVMLAVFLWVLGWYWATALEVASIWWRSDTYAHGLIVIPVAVWLIWEKRTAIEGRAIVPVPWLAIPIAVAGVGWLLGQLTSVDVLSHLSVFLMLVLSLVGVIGWQLGRVLAFPLLFLFFGVPIGDFMLPFLMHNTAEVTVFALRLSGIPVYQDGLYFTLPNGKWSVVEACSGIRYLIASLTIGTLYAYLTYQSLYRRVTFVLASAVLPIIANWLRAYIIVMLGYHTDNRLGAGADHVFYGWVLFGVMIFLMFWIGARWREAPNEIVVLRNAKPTVSASRWPVRSLIGVALIALVIMMFPWVMTSNDQSVGPFKVRLATPVAAEGWERVEDLQSSGYRPSYGGSRGDLLAHYQRVSDGTVVTLNIAYYARQSDDHELVSWSNRLDYGRERGRWSLLFQRTDRLDVGKVRRAALMGATGRVEVWHWYWSNGRMMTSDIQAKFALALDRVFGRPDDAAFVAVFGYASEGDDTLRQAVQEFLMAHGPSLEEALINAEVSNE